MAKMPNRIIQESARFSPTLAALSPWAERLFWRMTTVADDFGRFNSEPAIVRATCFALFPKVTDKQIDSLLHELVSSGIIRIYQHGERRLGYFVTWTKYQTCRALKSKFPGPDDNGSERLQTFDSGRQQPPTSVTHTNRSRIRSRIPLSNPDPDPALESERGEQGAELPKGANPSPFDRFYRPYPRHEGKKAAREAFERLNPEEVLLEAIVADVAARYVGIDVKVIPHPATYLNGRRWEDETMPSKLLLASGGANGRRNQTGSSSAPGGADSSGNRPGHRTLADAEWESERERADAIAKARGVG
jgi:hypothetical protein